jgi:serine/threonine protein kinase
MSASESNSANYVLLIRLADELAARYRAGEPPPLQEYLDRYPDLADDIRELFPAMVEMEQGKQDRQEDAEQTAAPAAPALQQLGDFRILREVGKGGMGVVYEAEQVSLGRHVALKVLPRKMLVDARAKRRFEREAKAAARLHHTNIVPVFGVGEQDGPPYYVMQFIQGLGLDEVLEELKKLQSANARTGTIVGQELRVSRRELSAVQVARSLLTGDFQPTTDEKGGEDAAAAPEPAAGQAKGPAEAPRSPARSDSFTPSSSSVVLPGRSRSRSGKPTYWQSIASIGVQVAEALEYAHKQGIHHRDIKPSNLLLDMRGTVWVTDFGLAKADDQPNLTHTGDILGTLRYMPTEAFEGKTDARGDVYALGLTLYELLAFQAAFDERERNRLIRQVTQAEPARLGKLNRQVPRDLETIVHKAIDRDPKRRYASAAALAEDLQRFIDDEPIQAQRASQTERQWPQAGQDDLRGFEWRYLWQQCRDGSRQTLPGHTGAVTAVALTPDGKALATCGADQSIRLWDLAPLQEVASLTGHDGPVNCVAFSPDGNTLATASADARVRLWQAPPLPAGLPEPGDAASRSHSPVLAGAQRHGAGDPDARRGRLPGRGHRRRWHRLAREAPADLRGSPGGRGVHGPLPRQGQCRAPRRARRTDRSIRLAFDRLERSRAADQGLAGLRVHVPGERPGGLEPDPVPPRGADGDGVGRGLHGYQGRGIGPRLPQRCPWGEGGERVPADTGSVPAASIVQ